MTLRDTQVLDCTAHEVSFTGADLRGTSFRGTDLAGAIFESTKLSGANLSEALVEPAGPADAAGSIERAEREGWYSILKELRADEPRPSSNMLIT